MTIKVRERKPKNGIIKLYLDIYNPKAAKPRTTKTLDLFLYENPKGSQKKSNKEAREAAERIRSKMSVSGAYMNNDLEGFSNQKDKNIDFIDYFRILTDKRFESTNNYGNWDSVHKYLIKFCPQGILIQNIDNNWLEDFKSYLKNTVRTKSNKRLSQNSLYSYFNKVKACLNQAHRENLILKNPANSVKGFKSGEVQREFLTYEELQKVAKTECVLPQLKKAFLFSALTGLRWSDIMNLTWSCIQFSSDKDYWFIRFRQQKTKGVETLPISAQAAEILGEKGEPDERVFIGLKYSAWNNMKLQQWVMQAGISKTITFHCARHTYATLQLTNGTDIYTVSKLLGHRELKTTQLYAKVIDQKKVDATKVIPELKMN